MINKVQSQPAAPQPAATKPASTGAGATPAATNAAAAKPADAGQLTDRFKDGFVPGKKPIMPPWDPLPPKDTMGLRDHFTASRLSDALSNPLDDALLEAGKKDVKLTRDDQGVMRGPDGQPLARVNLNDGNTAYVDPNTNQYYLTDEKDWFGQGVNALGPLPLPPNAQFSNSYFSDADVRSIERDARGGNIWPPELPHPGPLPFPRPFPDPLPRLPRLPMDPIPHFPRDPILLNGGGVKGTNQE